MMRSTTGMNELDNHIQLLFYYHHRVLTANSEVNCTIRKDFICLKLFVNSDHAKMNCS